MQKILAAAMLALPLLVCAPAQAQIYYPWCAVYSGDAGGATNCGFSTIEQCRATVSGIGGFCQQNPFYHERATRLRKRAHKNQSD